MLDKTWVLLGWIGSVSFVMSNMTFDFAFSQVWSEPPMQTTSSDPCPATSLRRRTSRPPPATSRTSSTGGGSRGARIPARAGKDPPVQAVVPSHRQVMAKIKSTSNNRVEASSMASRSIVAMVITLATTTDTEKGRGNTSVEDGRNVCKSIFSLIYIVLCCTTSLNFIHNPIHTYIYIYI